MRLSSLRYLTREGFRNLWQNRFMAIASIGVLVSCLLLTGSAFLVFKNIDHIFDWVYGQNVVAVFAKENTSEADLKEMKTSLENIENVSKTEFISKEEALQKYAEDIPDATFESLTGENNPMLDSFLVTFDDLRLFDDTLKQIKQVSFVDDISYNGDIAKTLTSVRNIVMTVGGWVIVLLLVVSLFIIVNTIKLTIYNRRLEIYIMKSVGATNFFIRTPFVIEGMVLGLIASGLSFGILYFIYTKLTGMFKINGMFSLIPFNSVWVVVLLGFIAAGLLTGMLGSAITMSRYLKDRGGSNYEQ